MRGEEKGVQWSAPRVPLTSTSAHTEEVVRGEQERRDRREEKRAGRGARAEGEDVVMEDMPGDAEVTWQPYEDLSGYEGEDEAPVVAPPTKKQATRRPAAGSTTLAGKRSRPAKTTPRCESPNGKLAKAMAIHGVPCHRPMAGIVQDVGLEAGIMGAHWLLGGMRRLGKAISSVVVSFERSVELGSQLRMRGCWHPIEAYDFDRGK